MAELTGEHRNLPAVMDVMRDEVAEEAGDIGTKPLNPSVASQGMANQLAEGLTALIHGVPGLRGIYPGTIELAGNLAAPGRDLQPHHTHIVHVRDDSGDRPAFPAGGFRPPCCRVDVFDQILVDAVVGMQGIKQRIWEPFTEQRSLTPSAFCGSNLRFWSFSHDFFHLGNDVQFGIG